MDTVDGVFMNVAYGWALARPVRKVFYNLTVTSISVAVALVIGTIELTGVLADRARITSGPVAAVAESRSTTPATRSSPSSPGPGCWPWPSGAGSDRGALVRRAAGTVTRRPRTTPPRAPAGRAGASPSRTRRETGGVSPGPHR